MLIDVTRFSSYRKLLRVTAYVLLFIEKMKSSINRNSSISCVSVAADSNHILSPNLINEAEIILIRQTQRKHLFNIVEFFENNNKSVPTIVKQLRLFMSNANLVRSAGRIGNSNLNEATKQPVLLPENSLLAELIVRDIHERNLHCGVSEVLAHLREHYWMPRGRQRIKSILRKCFTCLKVQGKPFKAPMMPDLPEDRVNQTKPFEITGVDYTGAISVKSGNSIIKAYIVLFTCMVTRASHLEVVTSISERDFIDAFIKFTSRRGHPRIMYSDNASNFSSAAKTSENIVKNDKFISDFRIKWKFITARAPFQGGAWERLIGMTKNSLKKVVGNALLELSELQVIITQIEARLNDHPLTYITNDVSDNLPLTPSHLLSGGKLQTVNIFNTDELDDPSYNSTHSNLNRRNLFCQKLLNDFWSRWKREYLTSLRERFNNSMHKDNLIKVGQIVLIHDDCPRVFWKLGKIINTFPGTDGLIRSASLKTEKGILERPITKLYPLEILVEECAADTNSSDGNTSDNNDLPVNRLPRRLAAIEAMRKMSECLND